ncbi:hypothetical protein VB264_17245 [Arcicella aquatica]|uniref:Uncharacterized protein n=1 Tax=Arcicella aquatica TaxID=217141 RepID=A0ABU5QR31_9BACT|nr:hypothetical protein [Arcicella aquatica]MEA5259547.1 hypothetical protein [Arcicella aquatica]
MAQDLLRNAPDNIHNRRALGWVYIELIKTQCQSLQHLNTYLSRIQVLKLESSEEIFWEQLRWQIAKILFSIDNSSSAEQWSITLNCIMSFPCQVSNGFSTLIKALIKHQIEVPNLANFYLLFKVQNFQSSDFQTTILENGKAVPALVERVFIALAKSWIQNLQKSPKTGLQDEFQVFLSDLDKVSDNNPKMIYLIYYRAILRLKLGLPEEARNFFIPFAQKKQTEFWVWDVLSQLYTDDIDKQIACLSKALLCKTSNDFLVKVRQKMAELLIAKQNWAAAKTEIEGIVTTRTQHNWQIPSQVTDWQKLENITNVNSYTSNKSIYQNYAVLAEQMLLSNVAIHVGIIWKTNIEKGTAQFFVSENINGGFQYAKIKQDLKVGEIFKFTLREVKSQETIFWQVCSLEQTEENISENWQKNFFGYLKRFRNTGFVEDVFIEEQHLQNHSGYVKGSAIRAFDSKKRIWGWKALNIEPFEQS